MQKKASQQPDLACGILMQPRRGEYTLYDAVTGAGEVAVPRQLVLEHHLSEGVTLSGPVRQGRRGPELTTISEICGRPTSEYRDRTPFARLVAVDPNDRFHLGVTGDLSMRAVDLIAPIGKGTRAMIVSPPKAGKTMLLEQLARSIRADRPETRIIVLLIDERPEEMTHFRRNAAAEVFASSSDRPAQEHMALAEMMLAHVRSELECGHDVVVLLDSLTRLARAFNLRSTGPSRTLSGGMQAGAMEIPRRFFGMARNIENGGSVTVLATALVDTGSRMDQVIFEEFKGTGNSEIVLDRSLAQERIFPAIDIAASGTRKEELLYPPEELRKITILRRGLLERGTRAGMSYLIQLLEHYPTNQDLLQAIQAPGR